MQIGLTSYSLGNSLPVLPKQVAAILRKFGDGAHVFMAGPGVPVLGPELVTNGDFSQGTTGWNAALVSMSVVSGELVVTALSQYGSVTQNVSTKIGSTYQLTCSARLGTSSNAYVKVRAEFGGTPATQSITSTANQPISITFVASSTTTVIEVQNLSAGLGTYIVDAVTFKEVTGYTNKIDGFAAGNYLESTGNTNASVDGAVGLVLDAAGSVGSELWPQPTFSSSTGLTVNSGWQISGARLVASAAALNTFTSSTAGIVLANKTYRVTIECESVTSGTFNVLMNGGAGAFPINISAAGTHSAVIKPTQDGALFIWATSGPLSASFKSLTVKEVTGTHATQATTANKPVLRRGIVNLLTYSNDLTNAAWAKSGVTASYNAIVEDTTNTFHQAIRVYTLTSGQVYTAAFVVEANGRGFAFCTVYDGVTDHSAYINLTTGAIGTTAALTGFSSVNVGGSKWLCVLSCSAGGTAGQIAVGAATADGVRAYLGNGTSGICVHGTGLFQGTLTAQQILDAGGIPLTTTAPASSSAGKYSLEFDGSNDVLSLPGPLFQMTDDFAVVSASAVGAYSTSRVMFGQAAGGVSDSLPELSFDSNGKLGVWVWGGGTNINLYPGAAEPLNIPLIATMHKSGSNIKLRRNGVQTGSASVSGTYTTATNANIGALGRNVTQAFFAGRMFPMIAIKGTVSDADLKTLEKWIGSLAGVQIS